MKSKAVLTLEAESCFSHDAFIQHILDLVEQLVDGFNVKHDGPIVQKRKDVLNTLMMMVSLFPLTILA
jgi:hypothetical protein